MNNRKPTLLACTEDVEKLRNEACQLAYSGKELAALKVADRIRLASVTADNDEMLALSNWTYGNIYIILGKGFQSLTYYQTAETYFEQTGDDLNLARLRVGMTGGLNQIGLYVQAYELAQKSWSVLATSPLKADGRRLAGLANNWGIACEFLGRYEEALHLYERKIALWRNFENTTKSQFEIARARINLGILKKRLNLLYESEQDLMLGRKALAGSETFRLDLARAEIHLAHLKIRQGAPPAQIAAAFAQAHETLHDFPEQFISLALFEAEWQILSGNCPPDFFKRLVSLHKRCLQFGSLRAAVRLDILLGTYFQKKNPFVAVNRYKAALKNAHKFRDCELIFLAQHGLGRVLAQQEQYLPAQEAFENGVELVEETKGEIYSNELRPFFLEDKRAIYYDLSSLHIRQNQISQAFHWIERARACELVDMLSQNGSPIVQSVTKNQFRTATPTEACRVLPDDTLLLLYAFRNSKGWILPITTGGILAPRPLNFTICQKEIEHSLRWLHNLSQYPKQIVQQHSNMLIMSARQPLAEWYEQLLAPVQDLLAQYQKLIVSPDGLLAHLPFHAFYNTQTGRYLIETHEVSRTPSATAWFLGGCGDSQQGSNGLVLAYADGTLHHTATEVEAIKSVYPHFLVYEDKNATLQVLQDEVAHTAAIIHMASHAVFRRDNPYFSYVTLANGRLGMPDILRLKLNARLVVLSACETGRGLPQGGEYLGLAQAFLLAGVRSIVASHWAVDDVATSKLMKIFYQGLAANRSPGNALRQAQLDFLAASPAHLQHPYYWAPFFLLDTNSIHD